jgi:MFS family permease
VSSLRGRLAALLPADPAQRTWAFATLANTFGNGIFFPVSAIYFTRSVGLSPAQVGIGLTVAGLCGLLAGVPAGHLADVRGPRNILVALALAQGVGVAAYTLVDGFVAFLLLACVVTTLDRAGNAVRNGMVAALGAPEERVRLRAYLRVVTNVGITAGAPLGGLALAVDTRAAYVTVIALDAATFVLAALLILRVPLVPPRPHTGGEPRLAVLRDRPYVAVAAVHAVLALQFGLLDVVLPLWVTRHTEAPTWVVAAVLVLNTVTVVALQVRASRGVATVGQGSHPGDFIAAIFEFNDITQSTTKRSISTRDNVIRRLGRLIFNFCNLTHETFANGADVIDISNENRTWFKDSNET